MALNCPRCARKLTDSADPAEPPLFCMYCGQKLRSADPDLTLPPIVMPDPPSEMLEEGVVTRSAANGDAETPAATVSSDSAPSRIAGFRLLKFLGAGGMGTVYEAEAEHTGQKVALKLLARRLTSSPASVERFRQEGRLASQISHPRCVFVLRADTDNDRPFIVMELMPGRTLKDEVDEQGPLPFEIAVGHILDVIDGLIEAHRLGVIHRDVKPSNCFLTEDGRVKVGDFGLSKSLGPDGAQKQITGSGAFLGTVLFASPEQIRGNPVGYDSDVYAVAATLYYLLTGRAPHQHESLTAALAKAISEPPPPICDRYPDVPAELERAVLRGLDRDRARRFQALEELRDALVAVLPKRQIPARPRALFLAYLIDSLLLQLAIIPAEVIRHVGRQSDAVQLRVVGDMSWVGGVITFLYFVLMEGRWGSTFGKRAMRLRVVKVGETGPPGLVAAVGRTGVYTAVWLFMFTLPGILMGYVGGLFAGLSGLTFFGIGLAVLCRQLWRSQNGYRGVHDFASGTRTVQLHRPAARLRLASHFDNPLDAALSPTQAAPEAVGGFAVGGLICRLGDGGEMWIGEDRSLGRRVLLKVEPSGTRAHDFDSLPEPRPHRLRIVGHGVATWGKDRRPWVAYVAPAGAPLSDVVKPDKPLCWSEARPVLEQLVAELIASEAEDGGGPLNPEQLWVEPNGRLQVLEFPLPTGRELADDRTKSRYPVGASAPLDSMRAVATLMLEGAARTTGGRIAAPVPPHASAVTDRLMTDGPDGYGSLGELARELAESHAHPSQVSAGLRAGHLTLQSLLCTLGLLTMFLCAGFYSFFNALANVQEGQLPKRVKAMLADDEQRAAVLAEFRNDAATDPRVRAAVERALAPDRLAWTLQRLDEWAAEVDQRLGSFDPHLNDPERKMLGQFVRADAAVESQPPLRVIAFAVTALSRPQLPVLGPQETSVPVWLVLALVAVYPLVVWPLFAAVFRGGLSMLVSGVAVVTGDGRPAARWRCAVREAVGWLPLLAVLLAAVWVQYAMPQFVFVRTFLWLLAVVMLPLSVAVAVRDPARAPHDRLLGTYLVPR